MALDESVRKKIAGAKTGGAGTRLKAGQYALVIKRILADKKFGGNFIIPEVDILGSDPSDESECAGIVPNKAGTDASFAWGLDKGGKEGEAALGNIKQFFCALMGWDESADEAEIIEKVGNYCGKPGDPDSLRCRGMFVLCKTKRKNIQSGKNAGKAGDFPYFTNVSDADGNSAEDVAKRREELDTKKR